MYVCSNAYSVLSECLWKKTSIGYSGRIRTYDFLLIRANKHKSTWRLYMHTAAKIDEFPWNWGPRPMTHLRTCWFLEHDSLSLSLSRPPGDTHHSLMPFRLDELIHMSLSLRNACLGMIECAHPETRPTVTEDYTQAMASVGVTPRSRSSDIASTWMHVFKVWSVYSRMLEAITRWEWCTPKNCFTICCCPATICGTNSCFL